MKKMKKNLKIIDLKLLPMNEQIEKKRNKNRTKMKKNEQKMRKINENKQK